MSNRFSPPIPFPRLQPNSKIVNIHRSLATRIMTRALRNHANCLCCLITEDKQLLCPDDSDAVIELLQTHPQAILVYNQNADSLQLIDRISARDGQYRIEVFQDTEGVFGLRAYRCDGKLQVPVTLAFSDD